MQNEKKELFLANDRNKQKFINLLASKMQSEGIKAFQADDDADFLTAKTALTCAESRTTVVIVEDTDILVLLCHHFREDHNAIIFRSAKQTSGKACRIWSINRTANMFGQTTCKHLPFVHAISGCDTTSRLYGIGKGMVLKKCIYPVAILKNKLKFSWIVIPTEMQ
jgi:5'-3' exonuclease